MRDSAGGAECPGRRGEHPHHRDGNASRPQRRSRWRSRRSRSRLQEYYSPGGGRGNYPVDLHTVVGRRPDGHSRRARQHDRRCNLKPGASQKIDVTIERAPGFKGNVTLDVLFQHLEQPVRQQPAEGSDRSTAPTARRCLTGEETKGFITLNAAADAPPVEKQLIPVMAHVSINFVMKLTFASEPVFVSIGPPATK